MPLAGQKLSVSQIKALWLAAGGPASEAVNMTAISLAESSGYTGAWNPGRSGAGGTNSTEYSVGLWQINTLAHRNYSVEQLKDPQINAQEAVRIYNLQGKRAWGAWTDGRYRAFMDEAQAAAGDVPSGNGSDGSSSASSFFSGNTIYYMFGLVLLVLLIDD